MRRPLFIALYLIISTALLAGLLLWPLIRNGMEINADSVYYIDGSRNLASGLGYVSGCPKNLRTIINFAPLYSVSLAAMQIIGLNWLQATQSIALISYTALTVLMFLCVYLYTRSLFAAFLAQIATAMNGAVLFHTGRAISEPLSWVIVLLSLMVLTAELQQVKPARTLLLAGLLSMSVLVRFANIGVLLGAAIAWAVAAQRAPGKDRLRGYITFTSIVGLAFAFWMLRNWWATGRATASSGIPTGIDEPWSVLLYAGLAMVKILLGMELTGATQIVLAALLAVVLAWVGVYLLRRSKASGNWSPAEALMLAAYGYLLGYGLLFFSLRTFGGNFILETRIMSPSAFLFILLAASAAHIRWKLPTLRLSFSGISVLTCLTLFYAISLPGFHAALRARPLELYRWRDNQTLAYAASHLDANTFITPDSKLFLLWAGVCPQEVTTDWAQPIKASTLKAMASAVVFLNREIGSSTILPEAIVWDVPARCMAFPDGSIYFFDTH